MQHHTITKIALAVWQVVLIVMLFLFTYTSLVFIKQLYLKEAVDFRLFLPPLILFAIALYLLYRVRKVAIKLGFKAALYSFGIVLVAVTLLSLFTIGIAEHFNITTTTGG